MVRVKFGIWGILFLWLLSGVSRLPEASGQGIYLAAAGPVSRSMGGTSVAAPLSALGSLYWNPATISGLQHSELEFGLDLLLADYTVSSTVGPISGSTDSECGAVPIPNVGWVYHTSNPAVTLGLGINGVAGFKTNLPASTNNPVLIPQPVGLGQVSSEASFLQLAPVISYALTDRLSIAAGPTITTAQVNIEPFVFDSANLNGTYSTGQASRYHWGGGVQVGAYYIHDESWRFGASLKSPTWMEEFEFYGSDALGNPRTLHADIDLPMIVSLGTSYAGWENWLFAMDLRYFDYAHADGLGDRAVFDGTGKLQGLDWSSIFALSLGVQRKVSESLYVRGGYTYNQNPIKNGEAFFNLASPLIYEHMLSVGLSYEVNETMAFNLAYSYDFTNTREGPIVLPGVGPVAGTSVESELSAHMLSFGIVMRQ